jgi:hypothetical protein
MDIAEFERGCIMPGWRWSSYGHPRVEDGTVIRFRWFEWFHLLQYSSDRVDPTYQMILPDGSVEVFQASQMARR